MTAKHEGLKDEIWARIAAPLAAESIAWRQDGKPVTRDGRTAARFVAYIEANTVRNRLDSIVPGEWDLTLEPLPPIAMTADGEVNDAPVAFKARLLILGVVREDVGVGKDYKQASTDAFKRVAVRFGIGHELYDYEQNWVELDGDGKNAKPKEDPAKVYARKHGNGTGVKSAATGETTAIPTEARQQAAPAPADADPPCPKCKGRMSDNRMTKRNPKAPDYKCRDRSCDGVIWPPKEPVGARATGAFDERDEGSV